jgi:hypothetical protein
MSNHIHVVIRDPEGLLPVFTRELHRLSAKAMNAIQGQWENLWSTERCNVVELVDETDIIENIAYVCANPVEAGLVESPEAWPGVLYAPGDHERVERVRRPQAYFGSKSTAPAELELRIQPPFAIRDVAGRIDAAVRERVERARARMRQLGETFVGRAKVLSGSYMKRATTREKRRQYVPQLTARKHALREVVLEAYREFRRAYFDALQAWRAGRRSVVFPEGTWWMRVFHGAMTGVGLPVAA